MSTICIPVYTIHVHTHLHIYARPHINLYTMIFLTIVYEGRWPILSLAVSSSNRQCTVSVLIIVELARGCKGGRYFEPYFFRGGDLNCRTFNSESSTLTTMLLIH